MEGVRLYSPARNEDLNMTRDRAEKDLKELLSSLAVHLFGKDISFRWRDDYFPFTTPSFELEVLFQNEWL